MRMIDDKRAYIKEVQHFLTAVVPSADTLIFENGIYDERTKAAVNSFKAENGMPADSIVDYETYELLYLKYSQADAVGKRTMKKGDRGDDVLELNMLLKEVGSNYSEFIDFPHSEYYSSNTERSVLYLRERFVMDGDEQADGLFVERLRKEYMLTAEIGKENN